MKNELPLWTKIVILHCSAACLLDKNPNTILFWCKWINEKYANPINLKVKKKNTQQKFGLGICTSWYIFDFGSEKQIIKFAKMMNGIVDGDSGPMAQKCCFGCCKCLRVPYNSMQFSVFTFWMLTYKPDSTISIYHRIQSGEWYILWKVYFASQVATFHVANEQYDESIKKIWGFVSPLYLTSATKSNILTSALHVLP